MASKESEKQMMMNSLKDLLRQLYEIETIAGDFTQATSQELLVNRLQELLRGLQQFKERTAAYKSMQVPAALCRHVDDGGHPDDFVRQTFTRAVADNQLAAGRVAAIQALKDQLLASATAAFPEAAAVYNSVMETKQQQQQLMQEQAPENAAS